MDNITTKLANKNGLSEERYIELVRARAREKYPNEADEISLLRKEIAMLRGVVETLSGKKLPVTKFVAYNADIENIKAAAKAETIESKK